MARTPEEKACEEIDRMLTIAGWHVCDYKEADIHANTGVVIRNFPLKAKHGIADYLFYIDGKAPYFWKVDNLWNAYAALEKSKVRGASAPHILTDLVSLVRFAMHQENELVPFPEKVLVNFNAWMAQQENQGKKFTDEQRHWLEMIRDHIAGNRSIETDDFEYGTFIQQGGIGKAHQVFGEDLPAILEELQSVLVA